jgi:tetratricopeptide (TPR) repeat protein
MKVCSHEAWRFRLRAVGAAAALAGAVSAARAADPPPQAPAPGVALPAEAATESAPPAAGRQRTADEQRRSDAALKEETLGMVRQLLKDLPNDAGAIGLMGTVCNFYGDTAGAATWWQKCLEIDPSRADAYHAMALIAWRKGEYQEALQLWRKAHEINPNLQAMYHPYAEALLDMGKPEEAIAAAQEGLSIRPNDRENYLLLGKAYLQLKEYGKAADNYEKARQLRPDDSRLYYGLAAVYARQGQADKAGQYTEQFKKLRDAEDKARVDHRRASDYHARMVWALAKVRTDAGRLYAARGMPEKAEEHWRRAAALDPQNKVCRQELVALYMRTGRERQALTFAEQLRAIEPKNAVYHLNSGALFAALERLDAAEEAVRKGLELAPGLAIGYRSLARILLLRNQRLPEAEALVRKLVELEPAAPNYGLLGEVCAQAGDLPGARAALERAMQLDPGNEEFRAAYRGLQGKE